jgi:hypothetical protein
MVLVPLALLFSWREYWMTEERAQIGALAIRYQRQGGAMLFRDTAAFGASPWDTTQAVLPFDPAETDIVQALDRTPAAMAIQARADERARQQDSVRQAADEQRKQTWLRFAAGLRVVHIEWGTPRIIPIVGSDDTKKLLVTIRNRRGVGSSGDLLFDIQVRRRDGRLDADMTRRESRVVTLPPLGTITVPIEVGYPDPRSHGFKVTVDIRPYAK